jgi:hypothetical protein
MKVLPRRGQEENRNLQEDKALKLRDLLCPILITILRGLIRQSTLNPAS